MVENGQLCSIPRFIGPFQRHGKPLTLVCIRSLDILFQHPIDRQGAEIERNFSDPCSGKGNKDAGFVKSKRMTLLK